MTSFFVLVKLLTGKKKRYARAGLFFARRQMQNELREEEKKAAIVGHSGPAGTGAEPSGSGACKARKRSRV